MNDRLRLACAGAVALVFSACGGGGSDNGDNGFVAPTADFNVFVAWGNLLTSSRTRAVSGIGSDGRTYQVTIGVAPGATSIFPVTGQTSARSDSTIVTNAAGVQSTVLQQTFFDPATLQTVGVRSGVNGAAASCDVATAAAVPPTAAKVGTSGTLSTLDELDGCFGTSGKVGTIAITWSLEFEAGISYFCTNSTERNLAGTVVSIESDCLQVGTDGTLGAAARVTIQQNGVTLVARS